MAPVVPERPSRRKGPAAGRRYDRTVPAPAPAPVPPRRRRGTADLVALLVVGAFVGLRLLLGGGAGEWVVIGAVAALLFLRPRR